MFGAKKIGIHLLVLGQLLVECRCEYKGQMLLFEPSWPQSPITNITQLGFKAANKASPKNNIPNPDMRSMFQYNTLLYENGNRESVVGYRTLARSLLVLCEVFLERADLSELRIFRGHVREGIWLLCWGFVW